MIAVDKYCPGKSKIHTHNRLMEMVRVFKATSQRLCVPDVGTSERPDVAEVRTSERRYVGDVGMSERMTTLLSGMSKFISRTIFHSDEMGDYYK